MYSQILLHAFVLHSFKSGSDVRNLQFLINTVLLSIPRISRDWAKYVELSAVRGNQIMTYSHHFEEK